ncbi:CCR4-NOT transcription complex subunit 10, partial [Bonamia ostreae]
YFEQSLILISKTNSLEWVKRDALLNLTAACYFSEDFVGAVHHAQKFLALKDIKETDRCLAALYSNESFCRLGKINEALKMLNPSKFANYDDFEREKALIYNNLACTYIVKGDLDRARICVDKALTCEGGLTSANNPDHKFKLNAYKNGQFLESIPIFEKEYYIIGS